ncbi:RIC1-domain-containing protein [Zopfochytrium polystomum]|nr:RIC1-domain-containing protein [Zopfochytrium polystomum]
MLFPTGSCRLLSRHRQRRPAHVGAETGADTAAALADHWAFNEVDDEYDVKVASDGDRIEDKTVGSESADVDNQEDLPTNGRNVLSSDRGRTRKVKATPEGHLFVEITLDAVYLWCAKPAVILSKVERSAITVDEDGENVDVIWKPDSSSFVITTDKGYIHFYDLLESTSTKSFEFQFSTRHHYVTGAGQGDGIPSISLVFKMALEIDTGIQCGVGLEEEILLCTKESPSLLSLSWMGVVNPVGTMSLADIHYLENSEECFSQIVTNASMDMFAWISTSGVAYLSQRIPAEDSDEEILENESDEPPQSWAGLGFFNMRGEHEPATQISINSKLQLLAVGGKSGIVYIYLLSDDRAELRFSHQLRHPHQKVGHVSALDWTSDGAALAVGWSTGGFAVWSAFGHLLMTSHGDDESNWESVPYADVQSLVSLEKILSLLELVSKTSIFVIEFVHSCLLANHCMDNIQNLCLISDDRLLIYDNNGDDFDPKRFDYALFEPVQIPITYITSNWPIRVAAIDNSGLYIAVAGKRGLAHYNSVTYRWKIFSDEKIEQSFSVIGGMFWWEDFIVAGAENISSSQFEVKIFSRATSLDQECLWSEPLPNPIVAMSNQLHKLMILTADNTLQYYQIEKESSGVKMELHQQILLEGVIFNPFMVQGVGWNPLNGDQTNWLKQPILILKGGELSSLNEVPDGGWEFKSLAEKVEFFWINASSTVNQKTVWAFSDKHLKTWIHFGDFSPSSTAEHISMKVEFYPLSIKQQQGVVLGLESETVARTMFKAPMFRFQPKAFAKLFTSLSYFSFALEILLYRGKRQLGKEAILPSVVRFVKAFPSALEVIASCARKSDMSLWDYFFSVAGAPQDHFQSCLEVGSIQTAASFLVVLQTLESLDVSGEFALQLLTKTLEFGDQESARELIRFYNSLEGYDEQFHSRIVKICEKFRFEEGRLLSIQSKRSSARYKQMLETKVKKLAESSQFWGLSFLGIADKHSVLDVLRTNRDLEPQFLQPSARSEELLSPSPPTHTITHSFAPRLYDSQERRRSLDGLQPVRRSRAADLLEDSIDYPFSRSEETKLARMTLTQLSGLFQASGWHQMCEWCIRSSI